MEQMVIFLNRKVEIFKFRVKKLFAGYFLDWITYLNKAHSRRLLRFYRLGVNSTGKAENGFPIMKLFKNDLFRF